MKIVNNFEKKRNNLCVFLILTIFCFASVFVALSLKPSIAPDERAHFLFIKEYAVTLSKPADNPETIATGWYIKDNPYLYYWISARFFAILHWINPNISDWHALQSLRLLSVFYSTLSLWFLYKSTSLLFENKWLHLLPVFLLSNTLMYVFLSGAVSYDPMAILFCFMAAYFLIRALNMIYFWRSTLLFLLMVGLGSLVKYPITPFAFITIVCWLLFVINRRSDLPRFGLKGNSFLFIMVTIVILANIFLYGRNLILYKGLTPNCRELFTKAQCEISPFYKRAVSIGVSDKPSLLESIRQGGPTPIAYFIDSWNYLMLESIYGILAHIDYEPKHIISIFQAYYLVIAFLSVRFIRKFSHPWDYILVITAFYVGTVFMTNINTELSFNYTHAAAIQGRYLLPVIGLGYLLVTWVISHITHYWGRFGIALLSVFLFFYSGPIKFILNWNGLFSEWFVH